MLHKFYLCILYTDCMCASIMKPELIACDAIILSEWKW